MRLVYNQLLILSWLLSSRLRTYKHVNKILLSERTLHDSPPSSSKRRDWSRLRKRRRRHDETFYSNPSKAESTSEQCSHFGKCKCGQRWWTSLMSSGVLFSTFLTFFSDTVMRTRVNEATTQVRNGHLENKNNRYKFHSLMHRTKRLSTTSYLPSLLH